MNFEEFLRASLHGKIRETKEKLEIEEGGNVIAKMQGWLSGIKALMEIMEGLPINLLPSAFAPVDLGELALPEILQLENSAIVFERIYTREDEAIQKLIQELKNWLITEAEKGRDLHWAHGKRAGLLYIAKVIQAVKEAAEIARSRNPLFINTAEELLVNVGED